MGAGCDQGAFIVELVHERGERNPIDWLRVVKDRMNQMQLLAWKPTVADVRTSRARMKSPERLLPRTAQATHEIDDQHDQQHEAQRASSDDGASEVEAAATEEKKQEEND